MFGVVILKVLFNVVLKLAVTGLLGLNVLFIVGDVVIVKSLNSNIKSIPANSKILTMFKIVLNFSLF